MIRINGIFLFIFPPHMDIYTLGRKAGNTYMLGSLRVGTPRVLMKPPGLARGVERNHPAPQKPKGQELRFRDGELTGYLLNAPECSHGAL